MSAARAIATAARAAAKNKAVRRVAMTAGVAAAKRGGPVVQARYAAWRDRRVDRDRAVKLARQLGATYSTDTIIDGTPHFVVWKDGKPIEAFPHVDDLAARPELQGFDQSLAVEPKPPRKRPR
jgi:hypothetical protein